MCAIQAANIEQVLFGSYVYLMPSAVMTAPNLPCRLCRTCSAVFMLSVVVTSFNVTSCPGLTRVEVGNNVSMQWTLQGVLNNYPLDINSPEGHLVRYAFMQGTENSPSASIYGDGKTTFGFQLINVSLSDAGNYYVQQTVMDPGQPDASYTSISPNTTLFVYGKPAMAKISQIGTTITCTVSSTSRPASYRPEMVITYYIVNASSSINGTTTAPSTVETGSLNLYDIEGHLVSCTGSENGSSLQSDKSDWIHTTSITTDVSSRFVNVSTVNPGDVGRNQTETHSGPPGILNYVIIGLGTISGLLVITTVSVLAYYCRARAHRMKHAEQLEVPGTPDEGDDVSLVDNDVYGDVDSYAESNIDDSGFGRPHSALCENGPADDLYSEVRRTGPARNPTDIYAQVNKQRKDVL